MTLKLPKLPLTPQMLRQLLQDMQESIEELPLLDPKTDRHVREGVTAIYEERRRSLLEISDEQLAELTKDDQKLRRDTLALQAQLTQ